MIVLDLKTKENEIGFMFVAIAAIYSHHVVTQLRTQLADSDTTQV